MLSLKHSRIYYFIWHPYDYLISDLRSQISLILIPILQFLG